MIQERMEQISQLIRSDAEHLPSHALHAEAESSYQPHIKSDRLEETTSFGPAMALDPISGATVGQMLQSKFISSDSKTRLSCPFPRLTSISSSAL